MSELTRQRPPFAIIEHAIIEDSRLSLQAFRVYAVLAKHADRDDRCFPSLSTIARTAHIGRRQVVRAIEELVDLGYISRIRRKLEGTNSQTSNEYTLRRQYDYVPRRRGDAGDALPGDTEELGGDTASLGVVSERAWGGDTASHELDPFNKNHLNKREKDRHPTLGVPLNRTRYESLCEQYGQATVDRYVQAAIDYVAANRPTRPYKDYAAAAANYLRRDEQEGKLKQARVHQDTIQDFSRLESEYAS